MKVVVPGTGRESLVCKGLYFDEETWDGSDLFMTSNPGTGWKFATYALSR